MPSGAVYVWGDLLLDELAETHSASPPSAGIDPRAALMSPIRMRCAPSWRGGTGVGACRHSRQQRWRCAGPGRPLEEALDGGLERHLCGQCDRGLQLRTEAVAPGMKDARWGRIVNISSGAGLGVSLTGIQAYASAKAAQIGLTRQLAHELGPWRITVNNIAPGFVRLKPHHEAVAILRRRRSARIGGAYARSSAWAAPKTSLTPSSSSRQATQGGSQGRCCRWMGK
ncbi:MAG: SDR family NAD(P)-dependent oxidoreductase [Caldilineaceae bacterium]